MSTRIQQLADRLDKTFGSRLKTNVLAHNEITIEVSADDVVELCLELRDGDGFGFEQLIDLCGVDYSEYGSVEWATTETSTTGFSRGFDDGSNARLKFGDVPKFVNTDCPRFAAVYHLLSLAHNHRLRVRVFAEDDNMPTLPSIISVWAGADWYEREAFDLFGILFEGHPDLRRILTDYGFVGHPFRKDFPLIGHVEMKYDEEQKRVIYQPVTIEPRVLVPRVIREDNRFASDSGSKDSHTTQESKDA